MLPLRDENPSRRFPLVTALIIAINIGVFVLELQLDESELSSFFEKFGVVPIEMFGLTTMPKFVVNLFTSQFVHGGLLHLILNMWMMWIFADNIEDHFGRLKFLGIYLFLGIGAGLTQSLVYPNSAIPTIGASGAIAGIMGAYLRWFPRARIITLVPIFIFPFIFKIRAGFFLLYWLFIQFVSGSVAAIQQQSMGIAWWEHIGGFVAGYIVAMIFEKQKRQEIFL